MSQLAEKVSCFQETSDLQIKISASFGRKNFELNDVSDLPGKATQYINRMAFCRQIELHRSICEGFVRRGLRGNDDLVLSFHGLIGNLKGAGVLSAITRSQGYDPKLDNTLWAVTENQELPYYSAYGKAKFSPKARLVCKEVAQEVNKHKIRH